MHSTSNESPPTITRREFLKDAGRFAAVSALAGAAVSSQSGCKTTAVSAVPLAPVHPAGSDLLKIALVGCGGRGSGAADEALKTPGPTKLVALADVRPE